MVVRSAETNAEYECFGAGQRAEFWGEVFADVLRWYVVQRCIVVWRVLLAPFDDGRMRGVFVEQVA